MKIKILIIVASIFLLVPLVSANTWLFKYGETEGNSFNGNYNIGELSLSAGRPTYLRDLSECQFQDDRREFEETNKDCWVQEFTFDGEELTLKINESITLTPILKVRWASTSTLHNEIVCHQRFSIDTEGNKIMLDDLCQFVDYDFGSNPEWTSSFIFTITEPDFLNTIIKDKKLAETIEDRSFMRYEISNKLATLRGGAIIKQESKLFSSNKDEKIEFFNIFKGQNLYITEINTENLGDQDIFIRPFVRIETRNMGNSAEFIIYSNSDEKEIRILPTIDEIPQQDADFFKRNTPIINDSIYKIKGEELVRKVDTSLIALGVIVGLGIFLYFRRKDKQ